MHVVPCFLPAFSPTCPATLLPSPAPPDIARRIPHLTPATVPPKWTLSASEHLFRLILSRSMTLECRGFPTTTAPNFWGFFGCVCVIVPCFRIALTPWTDRVDHAPAGPRSWVGPRDTSRRSSGAAAGTASRCRLETKRPRRL